MNIVKKSVPSLDVVEEKGEQMGAKDDRTNPCEWSKERATGQMDDRLIMSSGEKKTRRQKRRAEVKRYKRRQEHRQFCERVFQRDEELFLLSNPLPLLRLPHVAEKSRVSSPLLASEESKAEKKQETVSIPPTSDTTPVPHLSGNVCPVCGNPMPHVIPSDGGTEVTDAPNGFCNLSLSSQGGRAYPVNEKEKMGSTISMISNPVKNNIPLRSAFPLGRNTANCSALTSSSFSDPRAALKGKEQAPCVPDKKNSSALILRPAFCSTPFSIVNCNCGPSKPPDFHCVTKSATWRSRISRSSTLSRPAFQSYGASEEESDDSPEHSHYYHFDGFQAGTGGAVPLPLFRRLLSTDLSRPPLNYLKKEVRFRAYQFAPGFHRNHLDAMIQLIKAAMAEKSTDFERNNDACSAPPPLPPPLTDVTLTKPSENNSSMNNGACGGAIAIRPLESKSVRVVCSSDVIPRLFHLPREEKINKNSPDSEKVVLCARRVGDDLLLLYTPDAIPSDREHHLNPKCFCPLGKGMASDSARSGFGDGATNDVGSTNSTNALLTFSRSNQIIRSSIHRAPLYRGISTPELLCAKATRAKVLYHLLNAVEEEENRLQNSMSGEEETHTQDPCSEHDASAACTGCNAYTKNSEHGSLVPVNNVRFQKSGGLSTSHCPFQSPWCVDLPHTTPRSESGTGYIRTLTLHISGSYLSPVAGHSPSDGGDVPFSPPLRAAGSSSALLPRPLMVYTGVDIPIIFDEEKGVEAILKVVAKDEKIDPLSWWLEAFMARVPLITYLDTSENTNSTGESSTTASAKSETFVSHFHRIQVGELQANVDPHALNDALDFTKRVLQFLSIRCTKIGLEYFLINRHHRLELIEAETTPALNDAHASAFRSNSTSTIPVHAEDQIEIYPSKPINVGLCSSDESSDEGYCSTYQYISPSTLPTSTKSPLLLPPPAIPYLLLSPGSSYHPREVYPLDVTNRNSMLREDNDSTIAVAALLNAENSEPPILPRDSFARYLDVLKSVRNCVTKYVEGVKKKMKILSALQKNCMVNSKNAENKSLNEIQNELNASMKMLVCGLVDLEVLYHELLLMTLSTRETGTKGSESSVSQMSLIHFSAFLTFYYSEVCDVFGDVVFLLLWDSVTPYLTSNGSSINRSKTFSEASDSTQRSAEGMDFFCSDSSTLQRKRKVRPDLRVFGATEERIELLSVSVEGEALGTLGLLRKLVSATTMQSPSVSTQSPTPSTIVWLQELVGQDALNNSSKKQLDHDDTGNKRFYYNEGEVPPAEVVEGYGITAQRLYALHEKYSQKEAQWWEEVERTISGSISISEWNALRKERNQWRVRALAAPDISSVVKRQQYKRAQILYFLGKRSRMSSSPNLEKAKDYLQKAISCFSDTNATLPYPHSLAAQDHSDSDTNAVKEREPPNVLGQPSTAIARSDTRDVAQGQYEICTSQNIPIKPPHPITWSENVQISEERVESLTPVNNPLRVIPEWMVWAAFGDTLSALLFTHHPPNKTVESSHESPKSSLLTVIKDLPADICERRAGSLDRNRYCAEGETHNAGCTSSQVLLSLMSWLLVPEVNFRSKREIVTHNITPCLSGNSTSASICISYARDARLCASHALKAYSRAADIYLRSMDRKKAGNDFVRLYSLALMDVELIVVSPYRMNRVEEVRDLTDSPRAEKGGGLLVQNYPKFALSIMKLLQKRLFFIIYLSFVDKDNNLSSSDKGAESILYHASEVVRQVESLLTEEKVVRDEQDGSKSSSPQLKDICRALLRSVSLTASHFSFGRE